ncbi:ATP-dependent Lon protease [bacterium]|nr:ATP-dependent Lon protease [bacterium]
MAHLPSINLGTKHHQILQEEFSQVSRQTIHGALKYYNNSVLAKSIRKRALELLEEEVKENKKLQ